jgi:iron complex transport system substrate-binding protein
MDLRRIPRTFSIVLLVLALAAPLAADEASVARRIVSLNPSLTAILVALGAGDRLVGVDAWSKRQNPQLAGLPAVGGLYTPNLEALVALAPDRVLLVPSAEQRDFQERLAALGIRVERFDPVRFEEVLASIDRLGRIAGREAQAQARIAAIRAARLEVERAVAGRAQPRTVLVLQRDPLFVVGGGNFIDEMLATAGARNVAGAWQGGYPRVSLEWLVAQAPEVILDASHDAEPAVDYWTRWASLPAVVQGRVVALPSGSATLPGPALDEALRLLARSVHGAGVLAAEARADPGTARP